MRQKLVDPSAKVVLARYDTENRSHGEIPTDLMQRKVTTNSDTLIWSSAPPLGGASTGPLLFKRTCICHLVLAPWETLQPGKSPIFLKLHFSCAKFLILKLVFKL
jgi:hypothetical protein